MAGSMKTNGTEELSRILGMCAAKAEDIASAALYEGAGVVADAYKKAAKNIKTGDRRKHNEPGGRKPTKEEKDAVVEGIGVSRFIKNGSEVDTMIGVAEGYAYPKGKKKAIKLLARSINHGTSFMQKQPVFRQAATQSRKAAQEAMVRKADEMIEKITTK